MKNKKTTITGTLGVLFALTTTVLALQSGDYTYEINSSDTNTVIITDYSGIDNAVNIPDRIDNLLVTRIGEWAFASSDFHSVSISSNVIDIGNSSFVACGNLTNIVMHIGVTNIGEWAFGNCGALFEMYIPGSVETLGEKAFSGCQNLSSFDFGNGLVSIGQETFYACTNLTEVLLPATLQDIGDMAFRYCKGLTSIVVAVESPFFCSVDGVVLSKDQSVLELFPPGRGGVYLMPDTVQTIGDYSFANCQLSGVNFPNSVTYIGEMAFYNCWHLSSLEIPGSVNRIGWAAFTYSVGLTNLVLSEGLTEIGDWAFAVSCKLSKVRLPQSLEKIGAFAFRECSDLEMISVGRNVVMLGSYSFIDCPSLKEVYFHGDSPESNPPIFDSPSDVVVYYQAGTTGWSNSFDYVPAVLWNPRVGSKCEVSTDGFGFEIVGDIDCSIVVAASTNLNIQDWETIHTNRLYKGKADFNDSHWSTFSERYYRLQMP